MHTQPVENIETVLGRFQTWVGSRNATEPGIRELSCEEALESGRYRWRDRVKAAEKDNLRAEPDAASGAASDLVSDAAPETKSEGKPASVKHRDAKSRPKLGRAKNHTVKPAVESKKPSVSRARLAFREVLADAVLPAELIVARPSVHPTRQVAMSARFAPAEHDLIKARATEAGITASAYIRQCVLEVEELRAQVQQAIAAMERGNPAQLLAPPQAPGLLSRIARRIFSGSGQTIAVKA